MRVSVAGFRHLTRSASFDPFPSSNLKVAAGRVSSRRVSAVQRGPVSAPAALLVIACLAGFSGGLHAQTVAATVSVGGGPDAVAVNPATNTIYVANEGSATVTVIDGTTNSTATVNVGTSPRALAVNPVTNTVYVANQSSGTVTVINGTTNNTTTVNVGYAPDAIAVNQVTNMVYAANHNSDTVTVINGTTNNTTTVNVGVYPTAVAVNQVTNMVYVANFESETVTVIDGATNNTATVNVGIYPDAIAVDTVTNTVYVANEGSDTVTVIDGLTNNTNTVNVGTGPSAIAVNPATNTVYVANEGSNSVTEINGTTSNTTSVTAGLNPTSIAMNPVTNAVYVMNYGNNTVTVVNGAASSTTAMFNVSGPTAVAVNLVTNNIYVANAGSASVTVIDGASSGQAATTTTVTSNVNPAAPGTSVTLTAKVSNAPNSITPADTVTFLDYAAPLGPVGAGTLIYPDGGVQITTEQLGGSGSTTFSTSTLAGGLHTLFVIYSGDASLSSSSGELLEGIDLSPAIASADSAIFAVGQAGSFTVTTTGVPAPSLSVTSGTLPSGVTLVDNKNGTATLSGVPAGPTGTYPFTIKASNGVGTAATQSFTLTVDQVAAITSASSAIFTVGHASAFTVKATGVPTASLSVTSGTLPSGVTFVDNTNGTARLSSTAAAGPVGTFPLTITASNGVGTAATQSFTLYMGQAPAFTSAGSAILAVGQTGSFTVTATGVPTPSFSVPAGALPGGVILVDNKNGTATLSGVPAEGTAGTYPFTITASNGVGTAAKQSFTLTLGYSPVITSTGSATFVVGHAGSFTVSAAGFPAPSFSVTYGTLPSGVTFVDNENGSATLSGTAAAGPAGTYPFTITASNAVSTTTQGFTLTLGQAPAFTSASSTTFGVGAERYFTVTATGTPAPTFTETGDLPSGVTFDPFYGTLSGTPASGTTGDYAITFTASNGISPNATQHFVLTVGFVAPAITSANNATFTMGQSGTFTVIASGTPNPTLSETYPLPSGLTFNSSTGVLSGAPAKGTTGTYPILFTAVNGINPRAVQDFTLIVAPSSTTSTTIAASANPVTYGSSVSFTAAVTPSAASGTVVFFDDGIQFGEQTLSAGKAILNTSVLDAGTHYVTAAYMSNATNVGSSATIIETVTPAPLIATASSVFMVEGGQVPEILPKYRGLVNHATPNSLTKQPTCSTTATPSSPAGTYRSSCSGGVDKNYKFNYESGTVRVYKPAVSVSPMSLSFGGQTVKTKSVSQKVKISNAGDGPLSVKGIGTSGTNEADFTETDTCGKLPAALAVESSCTISVTFAPQAKGSRNAGLTLATAAGTKTVTLSGTGR